MRLRPTFNFRILAAIWSCVFLAQFQTAVAADTGCGLAIKNLELKSINETIQSLAALKLKLDLAQIDGSSDVEITALKSNYENKEKLLIEHFEKNKILTKSQFLDAMKKEISKLQKKGAVEQEAQDKNKKREALRKKKQERLTKESAIDGYHAVFRKVKPGSFIMGKDDKKVRVKLTQMPEIMATAVTQVIYKNVAWLANARFPGVYQIEIDPSLFKSDTNPVERVSYKDVELWTKALNDLSNAGEPALENLIPGHQKGMKYSGFMTEAQREFLMKKAKTEDNDTIDEMFQRGDTDKLEQYAVFDRSEGGPESVTHSKPLFIDGQKFYGLVGNVWEWTKDWYQKDLTGGIDPQGPTAPTKERSVRGGSWSESGLYLRSVFRLSAPPDSRNCTVGFRLTRLSPD